MREEFEQYIKNAKTKEILKRGFYDVIYHSEEEAKQLDSSKIIFNNTYGKIIEFIPQEVSDEEYEAIIKYNINLSKKAKEYKNLKRTHIYDFRQSFFTLIFNIIGAIIVSIGILLAFTQDGGIIFFLLSIIISLLFFSIGYIIYLLEENG